MRYMSRVPHNRQRIRYVGVDMVPHHRQRIRYGALLPHKKRRYVQSIETLIWVLEPSSGTGF